MRREIRRFGGKCPEEGAPCRGGGRLRREALAVKTGYRAAADRCEPAWERYDEALHAAFKIPARTLPGLRRKLKSALKAAKDRDFGTFEESDYQWLDMAMGDMERLAG